MKRKILSVLALTCCLVSLTFTVSAQSEISENAEDMVVVATRTPTTVEKIGGSTVDIITAEDIEIKKITDLRELLKEVPGIDIASTGGAFGSSSNIFIRGSEARGTLVLIDGVIYNNPSSTSRSANIGTLTLDNIEKIEIIKGSQSVLYGSNATAGVINIITKKGTKEAEIFADVEAGSYSTTKIAAGARGKIGDFGYSVTVSQLNIGGFSLANADNPLLPSDGNTDEADSSSNLTISAALDYKISDNFDIALTVRKMDSVYDLDDYGSGYAGDRFEGWPATANPTGNKYQRSDHAQLFYGLTVNNRFFGGELASVFRYNVGSDLAVTYSADNAKSYDYEGTSTEISWQGSLFLGNNQEISFGLGSMTEAMVNNDYTWSSSLSESVATLSAWGQDKLLLLDESLIIPIGIRVDSHGSFGTATNYRVAPSFAIGDTGLTVKASYGTGFQAPSLFQLYSSYGSTSLQPETSETIDYGVEFQMDAWNMKLGATLFSNSFDNQIGFDMTTYTYANQTGLTQTSGLEFTASADLTDATSLTFASVFTNTQDPNGAVLVRRPESKHTLTGQTTFFDKLTSSMIISQVGRRKALAGSLDKNGNSIAYLDPYLLINASVSYPLFDNIELYGRVDNLLDTFYEEAWSYATPGRSFYIGAKGTF